MIAVPDCDIWTIINALHVAADQYDRLEKEVPHLARVFKDQAAEARRIAARMEACQ